MGGGLVRSCLEGGRRVQQMAGAGGGTRGQRGFVGGQVGWRRRNGGQGSPVHAGGNPVHLVGCPVHHIVGAVDSVRG